MTSETKRTIKQKAHNVTGPNFSGIVYASTHAGAIAKAKASRKKDSETWSAELSTGEDLYNAALNKTTIIDAPASIREPDPQADAFSDGQQQ